MNNEELKTEADQLMQRCGLAELLGSYEEWFVGGSYNYDLMCWRDLDVYVLDPHTDLKACFDVGYELTRRLAATKARFTNNLGSEPNGLYWGIKLGDERRGAWKLDVWFLDSQWYEHHANYCSVMRTKLTPKHTAAILEIKKAYWQRPEYRDTITSDLIYRAVLDEGVGTCDDFQRSLTDRDI
ncbi:MAG: hypothetical protein QOE77_3852 [Blastocatellia bacterium]|jgi:hypothetical protein|nr:hypothetical protein [Blastocatellia bacterium]